MPAPIRLAGLTNAVLGEDRPAILATAVLAIDQAADGSGLIRLAAPWSCARLEGE